MTDRGTRICQFLTIIAALGVITASGLEMPRVAMGAAIAIVVFALLPTVIGRRA